VLFAAAKRRHELVPEQATLSAKARPWFALARGRRVKLPDERFPTMTIRLAFAFATAIAVG